MAEGESGTCEEDYEDDLIDSGLVGILDMLNFKIVPKEPGDPNFTRFNEVIPPESRMYAAEYVRLQDKYDKLKEEMTAMASSSELQVREELKETKEALAREQKVGKETKEALIGAQREVVESKGTLEKVSKEAAEAKGALALEQKKVEKANEALANMQKEAEEAKKSVSEEQEKVKNLREVVSKMQQQLNEDDKKFQQQKEKQEKLEKLKCNAEKRLEEAQLKITEKEKEVEHNGRVIEDLRKKNEELREISIRDQASLDQIQKEKEKLEKDLRNSTAKSSQLQEKLSRTEETSCELQRKLDALQEKFTEAEDKLKEEIVKCGELKTTLEKATENINKQEGQLKEAAEIIDELRNVVADSGVRQTQFERVVQINLGLDEQVADLQRRLRDKTNEVENVQRTLDSEREEKRSMEIKLTRYRESLQNCNLELAQFIDELKNSVGVSEDEVGLDPITSLQSKLESLSAHVLGKLKSREDSLKDLQAELAKTKRTVLAINEHLRQQNIGSRLSVPPPPPSTVARRAIMPPPPVTNSGLPTVQSFSGESNNMVHSYRDITKRQKHGISIQTAGVNRFSEFDFPSLDVSNGLRCANFDDSDFGSINSVDNEDEKVTLTGCRECGRTFPTWAELYQHQKTVHTVQMSKKVVQGRATRTSVKSLFGTFSTKMKKKEVAARAVPKIKIKQRNTRSGAHWNIIASSPAASIRTRNDVEDGEIQNENTLALIDESVPSPPSEPFGQSSLNDDQTPSSSSPSNQIAKTDSSQHRPPLSEVNNTISLIATAVVQKQKHGVDETKRDQGNICFCGKKCNSETSLRKHIWYHTLDSNFPCAICGHRFKQESNLRTHYLNKHKKVVRKTTMLNCRLCKDKFYTMEQLKRHQAATHGSNSHLPTATGDHSHGLNDEQKLEGIQGDTEFLDNLIKESAKAPAPSISTHHGRHPQSAAAKEHGVDNSRQNEGFFCICGVEFSTESNLDIHIGYYTSDWKFKCIICSKRFYYLTYLRRHYTDIHKEPTILSEFKLGCRLCGKMFRKRRAYYIHYNTEHPKSNINAKLLKAKPRHQFVRRRPTRSQVATKLPSKKNHYKEMSKEHLGQFCVCGLQFVNRDTLIEHIAENSGDKKFQCNICFLRFKFLRNLQNHLKAVHNATKVRDLFGCQHCGGTFSSREQLRHHINHFHSKRPLKKKVRCNKPPIFEPTSQRSVSPPPSSSHGHEIDISRVKIEKGDPELEPVTSQKTAVVKHGIDHSKARSGFYCKCGLKSCGRYAKYNLRQHIKYANAKNNFDCPQCQLSFKSTYHVKRHMRSAHNLDYTLVGCSTCANVFENIEALREHKKSQARCSRKRKRIVTVDLTNDPTPSPKIVEENAGESHQGEEVRTTTSAARSATPQKISSTVSSASTISQLISQKESPTKKIPLSSSQQKGLSLPTLPKKKHEKDMSKRHLGFFCVCGTKAPSETALHLHIYYFMSDKKFECELCGHRSLYLAQLKRHLKTVHKLTNSYQLDQMGRGCSLCGKKGFASAKELTIHKSIAHSVLNNSSAQYARSTEDQNELQPSTSRRLSASSNELVSSGPVKNPSIIIPISSLSITPVLPKSTSSLPARTPASPLNFSQTGIRHAIDRTKLKEGLFVCICGRTFTTRSNLLTHISYMTVEKRYACPICKKKFVYMSLLRSHLKEGHHQHNPDLSGCTTCFAVFSSKKKLLDHSLSMHPQSSKPRLQVPQQPRLTTSPTTISSAAIIEQVESASPDTCWVPVTPSISVSLRTTNGPGVVTLPSNPSSSPVEPEPSSSSLAGGNRDQEDMIIDAHLTYKSSIPQVQHEVNHEMLLQGYFFCLCGQEFEHLNALNSHIKGYSFDGKFVCKTCNMTFLLSSYLRAHMLKIHKIMYNISNGCKHCGQNFPTNMQLYEHFRVAHNNGQMWEPRELKYTPPTPSQSQSLSQELPYSQEQIIEIQDQNAQQKSCEEEHAMEEQDPLSENYSKQFPCKCGMNFKSLLLLKVHIRDRKKANIFKCYMCPSTFSRHNSLKSHVVRVHKVPYEKGKYSCGVCAKTFETCERMKNHKKDVHGIS